LKTETKIVLGAIALLGGYWLFSKARALGNLLFQPGSIMGFSMLGSTPIVSITLVVQNTSNTSLTVDSLAGNVSSNGTLIGNVSNFSPVLVPGNSQISMPVSLMLQPIGVVNDIIRSFQNSNFAQDIKLSGFANVNGFQLPVNIEFNVGI
jgi:LEA14-like dessication related protein